MAFEKYEIANKPRYLLKNNKMKIIEVGLFALSTDQWMPIQRIESSYLHFHCSPKMLLKKKIRCIIYKFKKQKSVCA